MNLVAKKSVPVVRKPDFDFSDLPKYYMNQNPVSTHFLNSLHLIFPDGEKYFIRSVKAYADKITDPNLKERVKAFISQEAQHMSAHKRVWEEIQKTNPMADLFLKFYNFTSYEILEPITRTLVGDSLPLAITSALEHFTAVMAEVALDREGEILKEIHPEMRELLYWHAAEEIEHKAVAYDVYEEMVGDYSIRVLGMVYATAVLGFYGGLGHLLLMLGDEEIKLSDLSNHTKKFTGKAKPLFDSILSNLGEYFLIDFHPDNRQNEEPAITYLEKFRGKKE